MLLGLTVAVAYIHLGWFNAAAALSIASLKALIIILCFMREVQSGAGLVVTAFVWLGMLFFGPSDYRNVYLPPPTVWRP